MPPRLATGLRQIRAAAATITDAYVCRSCFRKELGRQTRGLKKQSLPETRKNSFSSSRIQGLRQASLHNTNNGKRPNSTGSLASTTAINAPTTVPPAFREFYQRLQALQEEASSHVDLSRLQLALRSLESSQPVVRVALLGLGSDGALAARKLARALLSDPLSDEEEWERRILQSMSDGRSLLLRYGEAEEDATGQADYNPLLQTLQVPSPFLRQNKVEILVANLNANGNGASAEAAALQEAILVPSLTTPTSAGGRVGFVRYPVHKAIIVTEGVSGAVEFGRFPATLLDGQLITAALSIPLRPSNGAESGEQAATGSAVDIDLATHALGLFRTSRANGARFSEEWQTSRISVLADWISKRGPEETLNPDVQNLLASILRSSQTSVSKAEAASESRAVSSSVPDARRNGLQAFISAWSADGHKDLQSNLDPALSDSRSWRRTVWWRLFWRIDDVTTSLSELLRRSWLTEAEQRLAFLCGQIVEAGLANQEQMRKAGTVQLLDERRERMMKAQEQEGSRDTAAELMRMPSMLASMQQSDGVSTRFDPPWPQTINLSRQYLINGVVPALHTKAQAQLFTAVSTIAGSTALGAWFYVATAGIALYEGGAIAALGLVWALRRLQKKWGTERAAFAESVREDGRRVLAEVEESLQKIIREGGRASVRPEDAMAWQNAKEAIRRCKEALRAVEKKP